MSSENRPCAVSVPYFVLDHESIFDQVHNCQVTSYMPVPIGRHRRATSANLEPITASAASGSLIWLVRTSITAIWPTSIIGSFEPPLEPL